MAQLSLFWFEVGQRYFEKLIVQYVRPLKDGRGGALPRARYFARNATIEDKKMRKFGLCVYACCVDKEMPIGEMALHTREQLKRNIPLSTLCR
ncbi:MAG: hypothetical protein ACI8RD_007559 [Bacillariaceae sp.]|jgi:hypothetical protein